MEQTVFVNRFPCPEIQHNFKRRFKRISSSPCIIIFEIYTTPELKIEQLPETFMFNFNCSISMLETSGKIIDHCWKTFSGEKYFPGRTKKLHEE